MSKSFSALGDMCESVSTLSRQFETAAATDNSKRIEHFNKNRDFSKEVD